MTRYGEIAIGELFTARSGKPKYIRDYLEEHKGDFPVYSASLAKPFGFVDTFEYDGRYLTWVMNGYGGRVQEISGRFSANRDRGVLVPRDPDRTPDLTYLRFAMEAQLMAAAVGRRVDGRLNEYTKLYPEAAMEVLIRIPVTDEGSFDYQQMITTGDRLRRIELRQREVERAREMLERAAAVLEVPEPVRGLSLGDPAIFELSIGQRVLRTEHKETGVPVYSANALRPFGFVEHSNLSDFSRPSLLWGIDGNFDWNFVPSGVRFATTDHCGRLQIRDERINPEYVWSWLKFTRSRYGFDRVFRASLGNVKAVVSVMVPTDSHGEPLLSLQQDLAREFKDRERAQEKSLAALEDVLQARMTVEI